MITLYAIKDRNTNEYTRFGGSGYKLNPTMTDDIHLANTYSAKGPATTFINNYNKAILKPNSFSVNNILTFKDLVVVQIGVHYTEL
jgi:hypothetical protein